MARRPNPNTPVVVYRGVTIRFWPHRGRWKAVYKLPGQKRRECYGDTQKEAQKVAETALIKELDPHAFAIGKDETVAQALLKPHGASLIEAARQWLAHNSKPLKKATLEEIRDLWLALMDKTTGHQHYRSLESTTSHFIDKFTGKEITSIASSDLVDWIDKLKLDYEARTVRNIYDSTKLFFKFCQERNYLDDSRKNPMEKVARPRARSAKKEIYTPDQMQALLDVASAMASPATAAMVMTAFAAVRTGEMSSNDPKRKPEDYVMWEDIRWKERQIYIRDTSAKLRIARLVPIRPNLFKMLEKLRGKGRIYSDARLDLDYAAIAAKAGIVWKANALRHSQITYDMLLTSSPAEVANRAGNSVQTIESNYRNRGATKAQALAWFKLMPQTKWGGETRNT